MKKIIILFLFPMFVVCCGNRQQPAISPKVHEVDVAAVVNQLMKGMIDADQSLIEPILADELVYVHSNGRVQDKSDLIAEIVSGNRRFLSIETLDQTIQMAEDAAVVQHIFAAETRTVDGVMGSIKVNVMQVWLFQNGKWKLLARQGYRM